MVATHTGVACASSCAPTTGSSQCCRVPPIARNPPDATEPTASRIIGQVMTAGDSCGMSGLCVSRRFARRREAQRFSPKNVISITRVM